MAESLHDFRIQKAIERGFIRPDDNEVQQAIGLEAMHEAPLNQVGKYLMQETVTLTIPDSQVS